jgi:hypothetical protein
MEQAWVCPAGEPTTYDLHVGNVGLVKSTSVEQTARDLFDEYVAISKASVGRASGEQVTLMADGEVIMEYIPGEVE